VQRIALESTTIASIGYHPVDRILEVEFKQGGVYQYDGVERATVQALFNAPSAGTYFASFIKQQHQTFKIGPDGERIPLELVPSTPKQIDFARRLLAKAGMWDGKSQDRVGTVIAGFARASHVPVPEGSPPLIETWLAGLRSGEMGTLLNALKARTQ
jgi:hypothetical protein